MEGAHGVAPGVYGNAREAFEAAYKERWDGDPPTQGAFYYYDAIALLGLALQKAFTLEGSQRAGDVPAFDAIVEGMSRSTQATGTQFGWNELPDALESTRNGERSFYQGLTGSISWKASGDRRTFLFASWTIENGEIVLTE